MVERNTFVTVANDDQLNEGYYNGIFKTNSSTADQTGGTIDNSTTETMIGETIVTGNTFSNGVMIIASGYVRGDTSAGSNTGTVKLYSGTNAAFGSNTVRKSINRYVGASGVDSTSGWSLVYTLSSEEDWTGTVYIQITGDNSNAVAGNSVVCESLVVVGISEKN